MDQLCRRFEKNRRMTKRLEQNESPDEADVITVAYTIHNYCNTAENYRRRVATFFANHLD